MALLSESLGSVPNGANLRVVWDRTWGKMGLRLPSTLDSDVAV